jgi:hypothetical protein
VATGAICSTELKRELREEYQDLTKDHAQIFGFDITEVERHFNMRKNYPEINCVSLLIDSKIGKKECVQFFTDKCIEIPKAYLLGYRNNNCLGTGCVRGGIGYWQKYQIDFPDNFIQMAYREHEITDIKGEPTTILKDQSNGAKNSGNWHVFLLPHPNYPNIKDLSMMKGRKVEPLIECNGFCATK